jgi:hypothetical protein
MVFIKGVFTSTESICRLVVSSAEKKKQHTTAFPKSPSKWNTSLGKTRSTAYESFSLKGVRAELYHPRRRIFLFELALVCFDESAACAFTLESGQAENQNSVRYKGKDWSVILPDFYQRVALYSNNEGSVNTCEKCGKVGTASESPLLARFSTQSGETDITISTIGTNTLKLSLLQTNNIEELGSLDSTSALFLPSSAKIEGSCIRTSSRMKTFYSWDFTYGKQRVLLTVILCLSSTLITNRFSLTGYC